MPKIIYACSTDIIGSLNIPNILNLDFFFELSCIYTCLLAGTPILAKVSEHLFRVHLVFIAYKNDLSRRLPMIFSISVMPATKKIFVILHRYL